MSPTHTLDEIKSEVNRLGARIQASDELLPTYGYSDDGARPHIEVDLRGYHYIVVERGQELSHVTNTDFNELLYCVFKDVTFALACKQELKHRVENQDARRLMFKYQVELLSKLSPIWGKRQAQEHERILQQNPFDDQANARADLTKTLREQGLSPEAAWDKACEKYPLPR